MLREARVRKGLTIRDVETATKIRSKYLEALEQDDFEVIPGSTYVKAFLRTYALYIKLDADEMVEEYRRSHGLRKEDALGLGVEDVHHKRSRTIAERQRRKTRRTQRGFALVGALAVVAVVLLAWLGSGWGRQDAATLGPESITTAGVDTSVSDVSSTRTTGGAANSSTTLPVVVSSGENVTLVLTVTEGSCWLVVHENSEAGAELYAGTLSAGGQKSFDSSKRYWMRVGDPKVLVVNVNGVPVELDDTAGVFSVTEAGVESTE
jgi:cytoskeleton protein RodZ